MRAQIICRSQQDLAANRYYPWLRAARVQPQKDAKPTGAGLEGAFMTGTKHTVAIVDDDISVLRALGRLLEVSGYGVELFASAAEALCAGPSNQAICLVIDCQLGHTSGVALAKRLYAAGCEVPIIFMTASEDDTIRSRAMALGCVAYLQKPFHGRELLASIAMLIIQREKCPAKAAQ
jgi:FixJ family two-component response regulator